VEARANTGTCGKYRKLNHQEELESQGEPEQPSKTTHPRDEGEGTGDGGKSSLGQRKMGAVFQSYCLLFIYFLILFYFLEGEEGQREMGRENLKQTAAECRGPIPGPRRS